MIQTQRTQCNTHFEPVILRKILDGAEEEGKEGRSNTNLVILSMERGVNGTGGRGILYLGDLIPILLPGNIWSYKLVDLIILGKILDGADRLA
jgi:hypothetical protein